MRELLYQPQPWLYILVNVITSPTPILKLEILYQTCLVEMEAYDYYMSHLKEQLEELEVLQAMFSSPGEFENSYDKAVTYVKKLSIEPPKILSCELRLLVSANQDSDEEGDEDEDVLKLAQAESLPVTHEADVSLRLPARSALIFLVALKGK